MRAPLPLLLAGAAVTAALLLFDYPNWQARRAEKKLASGDLAGALANLGNLEKVPGRAAVAGFNRGVVLCRMGNYSAAIVSFKRSAGGDSALAGRALYNLGTARIMEAGKSAAAKSRCEALLRDAVSDLQQSLAVAPSDPDAKANLTLARGRLVALASENREDERKESQQRQESNRRQGSRRGAPQEPERGAAKPGEASDLQREGGRRRPAPVDRNQALRMLDDAKGREALRSARSATGGSGAHSQPEKDW